MHKNTIEMLLELRYVGRYSDGLRAGLPGLDFWQGKRVFLLFSVQTVSGAHPACYRMDTEAPFPEGEVAGAWSWPQTSTNAEVKNGGAIPPLSRRFPRCDA
jgi:hypothetical protein